MQKFDGEVVAVGMGGGGASVSDGLADGEGLGVAKGLLSAYWWALLFAWVWAWTKHLAWAFVSRLH